MANKEFDKEDEKILRAYCAKLPVISETHHEIHVMSGQEILDMGYVLPDGKEIDPEEKYEYKMPVVIAVNHYRRLKIAWLKNREAGVDKYIKDVAEVMTKNGLLNDKTDVMIPEGEVKTLRDTIVSSFSFWQKVRILFGAKVRISMEIKCSEKPFEVISSASIATVDNLFSKNKSQ